MGNCYSSDNNAEDHIHTDITWTLRNRNRGIALERSLGGGGGGGLNMFYEIRTVARSFCSLVRTKVF